MLGLERELIDARRVHAFWSPQVLRVVTQLIPSYNQEAMRALSGADTQRARQLLCKAMTLLDGITAQIRAQKKHVRHSASHKPASKAKRARRRKRVKGKSQTQEPKVALELEHMLEETRKTAERKRHEQRRVSRSGSEGSESSGWVVNVVDHKNEVSSPLAVDSDASSVRSETSEVDAAEELAAALDQFASMRALTLNNMACVASSSGEYRAALTSATKALDATLELATKPSFRGELFIAPAELHLNLAAVNSSLGRHRTAALHAQCALDRIGFPFADDEDVDVASVGTALAALQNLGVQREYLRQYVAALNCFETAFLTAQQWLGEDHIRTEQLKQLYSSALADVGERQPHLREELDRKREELDAEQAAEVDSESSCSSTVQTIPSVMELPDVAKMHEVLEAHGRQRRESVSSVDSDPPEDETENADVHPYLQPVRPGTSPSRASHTAPEEEEEPQEETFPEFMAARRTALKARQFEPAPEEPQWNHRGTAPGIASWDTPVEVLRSTRRLYEKPDKLHLGKSKASVLYLDKRKVKEMLSPKIVGHT